MYQNGLTWVTRSGDCDASGRNEGEARARPGESHYFVVTGGGPGLIEAANLGVYVASFKDPEAVLSRSSS